MVQTLILHSNGSRMHISLWREFESYVNHDFQISSKRDNPWYNCSQIGSRMVIPKNAAVEIWVNPNSSIYYHIHGSCIIIYSVCFQLKQKTDYILWINNPLNKQFIFFEISSIFNVYWTTNGQNTYYI